MEKKWPGSARCVAAARRDIRHCLAGWDLAQLADAAELVVSELFGNAVLHAREPGDAPIETRYRRVPGGVLIEVFDSSPTVPVRRSVALGAESGRGLALVAAVTDGQWGVRGGYRGGKCVWGVVRDDMRQGTR